MAADCATYYNYFSYGTANTKPWYVSAERETFGYCNLEFLGMQVDPSGTRVGETRVGLEWDSSRVGLECD